MTSITPYLWFTDDAEAALELYTGLFPDARVFGQAYYGEGMPLPAGTPFGLSWQIIPQAFLDYASDPDPAKVQRVMAAMLQMQKMDVATLTAAYNG